MQPMKTLTKCKTYLSENVISLVSYESGSYIPDKFISNISDVCTDALNNDQISIVPS